MNLLTITLLNYACHKQSQNCELKVNEYKEFIYLNKQRHRHRLDGPAVVWADGSQEWYQNGQRHRLDGPAMIWIDGIQGWFVNGETYSEKDFKRLKK